MKLIPASRIPAIAVALSALTLSVATPAFAGPKAPTSISACANVRTDGQSRCPAYGPSPGITLSVNVSLAPVGVKVFLTLGGFTPGEPIVIFLPPVHAASTAQPVVLANAVAGPDGTAVVPALIPASVTPGAYQVVAQGISTSGKGSDPTGVSTLTVAPVATSASSSSAPATASSSAARTVAAAAPRAAGISLAGHTTSGSGSNDASALVGVGAVVLGAGGMFLLTRRRRSVRSS